jgi:hypothetical protein
MNYKYEPASQSARATTVAKSSEVIHMTTREAKRVWRHRQAAIAAFIRDLEKSPEKTSRDRGLIERIICSYRREWNRYQQLVHSCDRNRLHVSA